MKHQTIFALIALLALTACNGSHNNAPRANPAANGHYLVTPTVMKGECDQPEPLVMIIWKNEVHNDGLHGDLDITGSVDGFEVTGIATDAEGSQIVFDALLSMDHQHMVGEWYSTAGDCEGPLNGVRI